MTHDNVQDNSTAFTVVLGIAQDGGYPQVGCRRACCRAATEAHIRRHVTCLAIVDSQTESRWLIDCTPDFPRQWALLDEIAGITASSSPTGLLLTHAHSGHYTGLVNFGREMLAAESVPTFVMPRMVAFLTSNEPWASIIRDGNVALRVMSDGMPIDLSNGIQVTPFGVPHRGEFSETVGFEIAGTDQRVLYVPDADHWDGWGISVEDRIANVDVAYLDGTFFSADELPGRDMSQVPHPTIIASLERFAALPDTERSKIRFLHFNHTNPAIDDESEAAKRIRDAGFGIASEGECVGIATPDRD
jgi:pyrroloquinoline quinone biosynthesis protein B